MREAELRGELGLAMGPVDYRVVFSPTEIDGQGVVERSLLPKLRPGARQLGACLAREQSFRPQRRQLFRPSSIVSGSLFPNIHHRSSGCVYVSLCLYEWPNLLSCWSVRLSNGHPVQTLALALVNGKSVGQAERRLRAVVALWQHLSATRVR